MRFPIKTLFILFSLNITSSADILTDKMYSFVGIQASYTNYDSETAPTIGFKYGKQTDTWRTALSYNYAQNTDNTYQSFIMQVDAGVLTELFKDIPIKPYLGFSFGVMEQRNSANEISKDRGLVYGINTGLNYVLNNSLDVDLGYRYMDSNKLRYIEDRGDISLSLHYYFD